MDKQDEIVTHSPLPETEKKEKLLSFPEAMEAVKFGKRISKKEWNNTAIYGYLATDGHLKINLTDKLSDWILNDGDINGMDWFVLEEVN